MPERSSLWRDVPADGVHRDRSGEGRLAVLRSDNRRCTTEERVRKGGWAARIRSLGCHRFPSGTIRLRLSEIALKRGKLWRSFSDDGAPERLAAHQPATAIGEDGWAPEQAGALFLAPASGMTPGAPALRSNGAPNRGSAGASRITGVWGSNPGCKGRQKGRRSRKSLGWKSSLIEPPEGGRGATSGARRKLEGAREVWGSTTWGGMGGSRQRNGNGARNVYRSSRARTPSRDQPT